MKRPHIYFLLSLALLIHLTVLNHLRVFGAAPDLMLIIVIFFGLFFGPGAGLESGIAAGILKDLFTLDFFGINTVIYGVTGLMIGLANEKFYKESKATQVVLAMSFTLSSMSLHYLLASVLSKTLALNFAEYLITSIMPACVYTGLAAVPIFVKLIAIYKLRHLEELL